MIRWVVRARRWLALGAVCASVGASAGQVNPCDAPRVFPDAAAQVFILPYESDRRLSNSAAALVTILQRHVLFAALKYPSIAVTELTTSGRPCQLEPTLRKLKSQLKPNQRVIVLSGRIFEQSGHIYLKSRVTRLTRGDSEPGMLWPLGADLALHTSLPSTIASFAPRTIPLSFLDHLQGSQSAAQRVHQAPRDDAPSRPMPIDPDTSFQFVVLEARDDWMKIAVRPFGIEGWIRAHTLASGDELKGSFPELYFIDGLVGYDSLAQHPKRAITPTRNSLQRYLDQTETTGESEPRALAAVLRGNALLLGESGAWSLDTLRQAQGDYRRARTLEPQSAIAANHDLACTAMICTRAECGAEAASLHADYLQALALDPTHPDTLKNLDSYYTAVERRQLAAPLSEDSLRAQRELLRDALEQRRSP